MLQSCLSSSPQQKDMIRKAKSGVFYHILPIFAPGEWSKVPECLKRLRPTELRSSGPRSQAAPCRIAQPRRKAKTRGLSVTRIKQVKARFKSAPTNPSFSKQVRERTNMPCNMRHESSVQLPYCWMPLRLCNFAIVATSSPDRTFEQTWLIVYHT